MMSIMACSNGSFLRASGGAWSCATATGDFIANSQAPQAADFNVTGIARMDAGVVGNRFFVGLTPTWSRLDAYPRVHVRGVGNVTGTGLLSVSQGATTVSGDSSAVFLSQLLPGDVLALNLTDGGVESHRVTSVTSDVALAVDEAWDGDQLNRTFSIQKAVAVFEASNGTDALTVMGNRKVFSYAGYERQCPGGTVDIYGNLCVDNASHAATSYGNAEWTCRSAGGKVCEPADLRAACQWNARGNAPAPAGFGAVNAGTMPADIWLGNTMQPASTALVTAASITSCTGAIQNPVAAAVTLSKSYRCCYDIGR